MTARHTCRDCTAPVLVGVDAPACGISVTLDPQPVDNLGEALALVSGRRTFAVSTVNESGNYRRVFAERTASWIRRGAALAPIHPEHRCNQPLPVAVPTQQGWATGAEF